MRFIDLINKSHKCTQHLSSPKQEYHVTSMPMAQTTWKRLIDIFQAFSFGHTFIFKYINLLDKV